MDTRKAATEWQKAQGLKDAEMARRINVSRATWSRFKNGLCDLTAANERALNAVIYEAQAPNMLPQLREDLETCIRMIDNPTLNPAFVWRRCLDLFGTYIYADSIPPGPNQTKTKNTSTP